MAFPSPTPRQAQVIWFALTTLAVALTVVIVGAVLWGVGRLVSVLSPVLWPIAVAGIIAFILDPVVEWLVRHRVPRLRAIILVFGAAVFLVLGAFGSIVPSAVGQAKELAGRIQEYGKRVQGKIEVWVDSPPDWIQEPSSLLRRFLPAPWRADTNAVPGIAPGRQTNPPPAPEEAAREGPPATVADEGVEARPTPGRAEGEAGLSPAGDHSSAAGTGEGEVAWWSKALDLGALKTAGDWLAAILPDVGRWVLGQVGRVAGWVGVLAGLALIPIYAFYFLLEKTSIEKRWTDYLPVANSRFKDELVWLLRNINDALIVFFRGQVLVAICDGFLYATGFLIIGLPYALLLGLLATVLTIVPFLGAIVTCASALLISIVEFGDWKHPILVLVVFFIVQGIEGWVIQPKIIGDRVGLHPVTVIIALLVGVTLMGGILGGLLAIPATAVIRALMFRYVWRTTALAGGAEDRGPAGGGGG